MSEPSPPLITPSKRKRARRACDPCRKRKKKCDGKEPCQLCQDYEYVCVYSAEDASTGRSAPAVPINGVHSVPVHSASGGPESAPRVVEDRAVFDARKGIFVDGSSVLAFPRLLASSLESGQPPNLRNLVYNLGIRQERYFVQGTTLTEKVSLQDAERYSQVFFRVVHPWHAYLERDHYLMRLRKHYDEMLHDPPFEMLVAFVVALGSYFSWPDRFPQEEELVEHAITWMDRNVFPDVTAQVCIFYVGAWLARSIYQRATANPRAAWMSSCAAMHVVESMGLHREWDTLKTVALPTSDYPSPALLEVRRRMYWVAYTINRMISTEYGRSSVDIAGANCKEVNWKPGETFHLLLDAVRGLPGNLGEDLDPRVYIDALERLAQAPKDDDPVYITLVRGDIACLLYRRLSLLNVRPTEQTAKQILSLGQKGTQAACTLALAKQPWWKVISTPFQFLCVLLSIDSLESLKMVSDTLRVLLQINEMFATQRTREAYETAQLLIQIASQRKEKELGCLRDGLAVTSNDPGVIMAEAWADMDIDWMELMDPDVFGTIDFV